MMNRTVRLVGQGTLVDPLAYELRRLSRVLVTGRQADSDDHSANADTIPVAPGELAVRLASSFGLRGIDVDLALAVLGAEIDHEFAALLAEAGARTELGLLAALLPALEHRLTLLDAIGPGAPAVKSRLLRRAERDGVGVLSATRRFSAAVLGRPILSDLPGFAELVINVSVRPSAPG